MSTHTQNEGGARYLCHDITFHTAAALQACTPACWPCRRRTMHADCKDKTKQDRYRSALAHPEGHGSIGDRHLPRPRNHVHMHTHRQGCQQCSGHKDKPQGYTEQDWIQAPDASGADLRRSEPAAAKKRVRIAQATAIRRPFSRTTGRIMAGALRDRDVAIAVLDGPLRVRSVALARARFSHGAPPAHDPTQTTRMTEVSCKHHSQVP